MSLRILKKLGFGFGSRKCFCISNIDFASFSIFSTSFSIIGLTFCLSFLSVYLSFSQISQNPSEKNSVIDSLLQQLESLKQKPVSFSRDTGKVNLLNAISWEYIYVNPQKSIVYAMQALSIAEKSKSKKHIANSFQSLGQFHYTQGDFTKALEYWSKTLALNEEIHDKKGISAATGNIGLVYWNQGDYSMALNYFFKRLELDEELGNKKYMALNLTNIGNVFTNQGNYPKALEYYFKALQLFEETKNNKGMANTISNVGAIYNAQENYPKALEYYLKALKYDEESEDKNGMATSLGNIGNTYHNIGYSYGLNLAKRDSQFNVALEYVFKSLKIYEHLGDKQGRARCYGIIGNIFSSQSNYHEALTYYLNSLKIREGMNDKKGIAVILGNLGVTYTKEPSLPTPHGEEKKGYALAEKFLMQAVGIADSLGVRNEERQFEESLSQLFEKSGNYKMALLHFKNSASLKDSIFNEEKSKDIGRLEQRYEFEMEEIKRRQVETEKSRQLAVAVSRRNKLQYSGMVIGLFALFVIVFFMGRFNLPRWGVELLVFIPFLLLFEFILVLIDPFVEQLTKGEPIFKLLINALLAAIIFPLHGFLEKVLGRRVMHKDRG